MRVFAFVGQKGGTAKTTSAVSLACELVARGDRVLVVDADPQNSARTWIGLGASQGHTMPTVVSMGAEMSQPGQLDQLAAGYDAVVIDCPSRTDDRVGATMRAALMFVGSLGGAAVLPCGPSAMDVWALAETIETVQAAQGLRPDLRAYVLITRKTSRTVLGESARSVLGDAGLPVLATDLCYRIAYQEAPAAGMGVAQYAKGTPAASEVVAFVDELLALEGEASNGQATTAA